MANFTNIDLFSTALACINETCVDNASYYSNHNNPRPYHLVCDSEEKGGFISSLMTMSIFTFFTSLIGNGIVCYLVFSTPSMKTVTNVFIVNLSISDLLLTLLCVPFSTVSLLSLNYWPFGLVMCRLVTYAQVVSGLVNAYTMLAISIDQYMVIIHPLRPRLRVATAKLVVCAVWVSALITASPIPVVCILDRFSPWHKLCQVAICSERWSSRQQRQQYYTITLLGLQFVLPLAVLIYSYCRIANVVLSERTPGEAEYSRDSRLQLSKTTTFIMMVTVATVFIVCWLPMNIIIIFWTYFNPDDLRLEWPESSYLGITTHCLAMSRSCYNPIIYYLMNTKFRRGFDRVNTTFVLYFSGFQRAHIGEGMMLSGDKL